MSRPRKPSAARAAEEDWDSQMGTVRTTSKYAVNTLGWLIGRYKQSAAWGKLAQASRNTYENALAHLHPYGQQAITGLKRRHVTAIMDSLSDRPAMANIVLAVLRILCTLAMDLEIIEANPTANIRRMKVGERRRWADDEILAFYDSAPEELRRALILGLYTGQRRADLCKMLWSDIHGGRIRVVQQKTGAKIWVPIHPDLANHIDRWRPGARAVTILSSTLGRPWSASRLTAAIRGHAHRAGTSGATLHGLRKTAAAKLAEAGCSTKEIMAITGHASISEVERYTRGAEQSAMADTAVRKMQGLNLASRVRLNGV